MSKEYAKQKVKELAGGLLTKLKKQVEGDDSDDDTPPKPPPKPSSYTPSGPLQSLTDALSGFSISSNTPFVGGFNLGHSAEGKPPLYHASSDPPPSMPTPFGSPPGGKQSLTMQMALSPNGPYIPPTRPYSAPAPFTDSELDEIRPVINPSTPTKPSKKPRPSSASKPSSGRPSSSSPTPSPSKASGSKQSTSKQSTPQRPARVKANSSDDQVQCSGITKAGKQCTRKVKTAPALAEIEGDDSDDSDDDSAPKLERFCHQHSKELLLPTGCYARKNGEWVVFTDWIPGYLQIETQLALRIEMERARTLADVDGYIYTFEIREERTTTIKLKVGRAVNLVKRIDEWGKQCGSKEQVLRGFHPNPEDDQAVTLMKGRVKAGEKAPCCHRLERLIHLELADLVSTHVYLDPEWPNIEPIDIQAAPASGRAQAPKKLERCADCGTKHKEIFEFQRWGAGPNKAKEWEKIVKPVIERWGKFVELYV